MSIVKINAERRLRSRTPGIIQPETERKIPDLRINDSGIAMWFDAQWLTGISPDQYIAYWESVDSKWYAWWQQGYSGRYKSTIMGGKPAIQVYDEHCFAGGPRSSTGEFHAYAVCQRTGGILGDIWQRALSCVSFREANDYTAPAWTIIPTPSSNADFSRKIVETSGSTQHLCGIWIGSNKRGNTNYFRGEIGEILIYDRILSTVEQSDVETYLNDRWDL